MAPISKKFTFTDVGNQATFLSNIYNVVTAASAGVDYGWTVDKYEAGADGLLMLHSNGLYNKQNLYFSIKLRNPNSGTSHIHLTGQTGYSATSAYDSQPGKFTQNSAGLPDSWDGANVGMRPANFLRSPVSKQVIFVNKQFIAVFWEDDCYLTLPTNRVYPIWRRFIIGAMDGLMPEDETLLNYVNEVCAAPRGWSSSPFLGAFGHQMPSSSNYNNGRSYPTTGLLWKQPYDSTAVNKDIDRSYVYNASSSTTRWWSTINNAEGTFCHNNYNSFSSSNYFTFRLGGFYTDGTRYNISVIKHFLHRPIVHLFEKLDDANIFLHPIAYLPYHAVRMGSLLKGDDTISFGTKNFAVYPVIRNSNTFGVALEYIEGV